MIKLNPSRNLAAHPRAGCFPALFLLAGWLALVTPIHADNPPTYLFELDASAVPGGFSPWDVALDSNNNIYVTGFYNNRVAKFTSQGNYLTQWGSLGTNNDQFNSPSGIAADSTNNVYVTDWYNSRVEKFDSSGNYLAQWGSYGTNNGQFQYPEHIVVDRSNNVYVTDSDNSRIEKFDGNGTYLTQWGSFGSGNGQFIGPSGIAVDRSNNVYVGDSGNNRIQKFDSNGNYLTQWGSIGLRGIAVDSTGNYIFEADRSSRIQVLVYNAHIVPPIITSQPVSQTVLPGINVTFSVSVVGTAPLAYQWTSNNVALSGATNGTFALTHASLSDSATYAVLVTNSFGSVLSSNAVLAVLPALVTTQPGYGISLTGAVLNGSVRVGPDETVVWFEWGTDTNYGNITGATIVPGNNGYNYISVALGGLSGNIYYHYRLNAANDFGIVYGDDQMFTVGHAPTATTLAAVNSTNGSTLNAVVNPGEWDTTVYFHWITPTLTNSTPGMDIGAGVTSLNVRSFVPGLAPFTPYQYRVMASNALGTVLGEVVSWTPPFVNVSGEAGVVFTSFHSFSGDDGAGPNGLVEGNDGDRSEERRVGKECRSRWSPYH